MKTKRTHGCWASITAVALAGCSAMAPAPTSPSASSPGSQAGLVRYRCDPGEEVRVHFTPDSATIDLGPRGSEQLLRDAGGVTPQQTVYSNPRLRAEFGLGDFGRAAQLHHLEPPLVTQNCVRD